MTTEKQKIVVNGTVDPMEMLTNLKEIGDNISMNEIVYLYNLKIDLSKMVNQIDSFLNEKFSQVNR